MAFKTCKVCHEGKSDNEFYYRKGRPDGTCIACRKIQAKEYKIENKEKIRVYNAEKRREYKETRPGYADEQHLWVKYGITAEHYDMMAARQNGVCAICFGHQDKLAVDHCHESTVIRGLLCDNCNVALGLFKDNPDYMRRAAAYIEKAPKAENSLTFEERRKAFVDFRPSVSSGPHKKLDPMGNTIDTSTFTFKGLMNDG